MNKLRIASVLICIVCVLMYWGYNYYDAKSTDTNGPVIEMESEEISVSIEDGREALLQGITATDEKDGDVTDSVVIESVSRFINDRKVVTYAAFDRDRNVGKATREVVYTDYTSPKFSSKSGFRFPTGTTSVLSDLKAKDCIDGDITSQIKVSPGFYLNATEPGLYKFQYQVANESGDVEYLPVTVELYDPSDIALVPQIYLSKYIVYTSVGKKVDAARSLDHVTIGAGDYQFGDTSTYSSQYPTAGGTLTKSQITVDDSKVDYDTPGTYEVTYRMKVNDENIGTNRLIVVVR